MFNTIENDKSTTVQFDSQSQLKDILEKYQKGLINYDDLTETQKEYIKSHDSFSKSVFI